MGVEKLKTLKYMADFSNLFLSIYSEKMGLENGKLYFPKDFTKIIEDAIYENFDEIKKRCFKLLDENLDFDIDSLMKCFRYSSAKKYWDSEFLFDLDKNMIWTKMEQKDAKNVIAAYDKESIQLVTKIVNSFLELSTTYENVNLKFDKKERNYIKLI